MMKKIKNIRELQEAKTEMLKVGQKNCMDVCCKRLKRFSYPLPSPLLNS